MLDKIFLYKLRPTLSTHLRKTHLRHLKSSSLLQGVPSHILWLRRYISYSILILHPV